MDYHWVFPREPISIKSLITFSESWNNIDVSSVVPTGTKAIIVYIGWSDNDFIDKSSIRSKGATDMIKVRTIRRPRYERVNLDANYIFEGYFPNDGVEVKIKAYEAPTKSSSPPPDPPSVLSTLNPWGSGAPC